MKRINHASPWHGVERIERRIGMDDRPGCLGGLLKLALLGWLFDWLQDNFGFGRGASCTGCGCGVILLLIFLALVCSTIGGTDWFRLVQTMSFGLI